MTTTTITKMSIYDDVEIMGHVFHGLSEIAAAVEMSETVDSIYYNTPMISSNQPKMLVPGIHIAEVWESYPCFDSSDSIYENRTFQNYFFSDQLFSGSRLYDIIIKCNRKANYQFVNSEMPTSCAPAVYYIGDGEEMILITINENKDYV